MRSTKLQQMTPRQDSFLAGILIRLRARSKARPDQWHQTTLQRGLTVAWKYRREQSVDVLKLSRMNTEPSAQEITTVLTALDPELRTVQRKDVPEKFTIAFAIREGGCTRCSWPIDIDAKLTCSEVCTICSTEGHGRCRNCGAEATLEQDPDFAGHCRLCRTHAELDL